MEPRWVYTNWILDRILSHVNSRQRQLESMETNVVQYIAEYRESLPNESSLNKDYARGILEQLLDWKKFESEIWETMGDGLGQELDIITPIVDQQNTMGLDRIQAQCVHLALMSQIKEFCRFAMEVVYLSRIQAFEVCVLAAY